MNVNAMSSAAPYFSAGSGKSQYQPQFSGAADSFSGGKAPTAKHNDFGLGSLLMMPFEFAGNAIGAISGLLGSIPLLGTLWNWTGGALLGMFGLV